MSGSTTAPTGAPPSRRERLIALSRAVREALVARFGPAWRSKTTEEIAREAGLAEAFGPEDAARLLRFLQDADRAKFADEGEPPSTPSPDHEEGWVEEFLASAGAHPERSRQERGRESDDRPGTLALRSDLMVGDPYPQHVGLVDPGSQPDSPGHLLLLEAESIGRR